MHTPVNELLDQLDVRDIAEYMAYDLTHDEAFIKRLDYEAQKAASESMSDAERAAQFKRHLRGK